MALRRLKKSLAIVQRLLRKIQPKFMDIKRIRQTTGVLWKTAIYLTILYLSLNVVASRVHTHIVVKVALAAANDSNS